MTDRELLLAIMEGQVCLLYGLVRLVDESKRDALMLVADMLMKKHDQARDEEEGGRLDG